MSDGLAVFAPAKVNLFLHVLARRPDGYHELESLIVFVDVGDRLSVRPADKLDLTIGGPFGPVLKAEPLTGNLVHKAAGALKARLGTGKRAWGGAVHLDKHLPVASGIGGGSTDAAAALRLLARHWDLPADTAVLREIGLDLGADVPVCLSAAPMLVEGIGETLRPAPPLPEAWLVLVNSGTGVSTGAVFKGLDPSRFDPRPSPAMQAGDLSDMDRLLDVLKSTRNDLEASALTVAPDIREVLEEIRILPDCRLARMSGSGGTCFGLFDSQDAAMEAERRLSLAQPSWWVRAGKILREAPPMTGLKGD